MQHDALPDASARAAALDPAESIIVQAPAGSGKTTLLAERYLRLLQTVDKPQEILAITFTKKAAAEMRARVLSILSGDSEAALAVRERDARKGWSLTANPSQLKIQTIDSFAYEIASQSLGDANTSGLNLIEDATSFYEEAAERLLARLYSDDPLNVFVADFLEFVDNNAGQAIRLIGQMLSKRDQWIDAATSLMSHAQNPQHMRAMLEEAVRGLRETVAAPIDVELSGHDEERMEELAVATGAEPTLDGVLPFLLTGGGTLRKRLTRREHVAFSNADLRRDILDWIDSLRARGMETPLATLFKLPPSDLHAEQERILTNCCTCLGLAAVELDRLFQERDTLDFSGLLLRAHQGLRQDNAPTDLALQWDYRIKHVLVDEFQDTSRSQYDLFRQITDGWQIGDGRTFFAVGDPMQSIYRFRDADVSIYMHCLEHGLEQVPLAPIRLQANFRSAPALVDWVNTVFSELFADAGLSSMGEVQHAPGVAMQPIDIDATVKCEMYSSEGAERSAVIDHIQELSDRGESIGLLVRARGRHLDELLSELRLRGIAWQATDIDPLNETPVVLDLLNLHAILLAPTTQLAWFGLLRSPLFGMRLVELQGLRDNLPEGIPERLQQVLSWAESKLYEAPLREVLEGAWIRLGGPDVYQPIEVASAIALFDLIEELGDTAYSPAALKVAVDGLYAGSESVDDPLQIMTIHKSKGLEFDHVIVPFLDRHTRSDDPALLLWDPTSAGLLMGIRDDPIHDWLRFQGQSRDVNEQKRLLYVAFTRARKSLFTSFVADPEKSYSGLARWLEGTATYSSGSLSAAPLQADEVGPIQADLFAVQTLRRLPDDYAWQPPKYTALAPTAKAAPVVSDPIAGRFEVDLGTLVHRALASIAMQGQSGPWRDALPHWALQITTDKDTAAALVATALEHLDGVLDDQTGQWLLSARTEAVAEIPLTGIVDDEIQHIVIDRMFVDEDVRWIVDYKTGAGDIGEETTRYTPQLQKYRAIVGLIHPGETIKIGLYFTARREFVEIT